MEYRRKAENDSIFKMEYSTKQVDAMVDDIKDSAEVLAKVIFAGFNIVFLVVLGVILITNLSAN